MRRWGFIFLFFCFSAFAQEEAPPLEVNLLFPDRTIKLNFSIQKELLQQTPYHSFLLGNKKFFLDTEDTLLSSFSFFPLETSFQKGVSPSALHEFLRASSLLYEETEDSLVKISFDEKNGVSFEGTPRSGFVIDEDVLVKLINIALSTDKKYVVVPAQRKFTRVEIDPALQEKGIREIISIGESNFTGSSIARKQNIKSGLKKYNGLIIPKGARFSFNEHIADLSPKDGFVSELVIKGDKTEKELGGGICQVSTTAFRAAFFGGLPILQRRNHSFAVPYYTPYGLDAAIYLGASDFRFQNDTPGDILIQAFSTEGDNVFFVFYGTSDQRIVSAEGPFLSGHKKPGDPIVYESEDLIEGQVKEIGKAYDGFLAKWLRVVQKEGEKEKREIFSSRYRPWNAVHLIGTKKLTSQSSP